MSLSKFFLLITSFLFLVQVNAQRRIESQGNNLPKKFRKNNSETIDSLVEGDTILLSKNSKKSFFAANNYFLDNLYNSGLVIFGNDLNIYMENIVDELLINDLDTRKHIDLFLIKSEIPNAFTTLDGSIFVNVGLIARLGSKDELAFILAHEIGHYMEGHGIEKHAQGNQVRRKEKRSNKRSELNSTLERCLFSREKESEADSIGLELFEASNYSWKALSPLFKTLKYSNLPVFNTSLSVPFFESEYLNIIDSILLDGLEIRDINNIHEEDSKFSTHPAPDERLDILEKSALRKSDSVSTNNEFRSFVAQCLFETTALYIENYDFFSAMYMSKYLGETKPNDSIIGYQMLRALYGISKFRTNKNRNYIKPTMNHRYSEFFYNTYDFLRKEANALDVCAIAISEGNKYLHQSSYHKDEIETLIDNLWKDYDMLKGSMKHKYVKFDTSFRSKEELDRTIVFQENQTNEEMVKFHLDFSKLVIVNPVYSPNMKKAQNSTYYFLKSIQDRKMYIESLRSTWTKEQCKFIDSKTTQSDNCATFKDGFMLYDFYQESLLTNLVPDFVSSYSYQLNEFRQREDVNKMLIFGSKPIYGEKAKTLYYAIIIDLRSGKTIYKSIRKEKSPVSVRNAISYSNKILTDLKKNW